MDKEMDEQTDSGASRWSHHWLGVFLLAVGCAQEKEPDNPYVGNMDDFSYSGQITPERNMRRVNANGRMVTMDEYKGRFVWADYAAPWCQPCVAQAQAIKSIENSLADEVVFLTVMTSASQRYEDAPDQKTARAWATRFGLNSERVVAATNLWAWSIPKHILYSPTGQTLYRSTGGLSANQIRGILSRYMEDWGAWSREGRIANWMKPGSRPR